MLTLLRRARRTEPRRARWCAALPRCWRRRRRRAMVTRVQGISAYRWVSCYAELSSDLERPRRSCGAVYLAQVPDAHKWAR